MPIINIGINGAGLNLDVIAIPNTSSFPSSPKENTIAVISNTAVNGWSIVGDELEHMSNNATIYTWGHVRIVALMIGNTTFNAIKKNTITIAPYKVVQNVNGVITYKPSYIYQGGTWKTLATVLFAPGNNNTAVTGGWTGNGTPTVTNDYVGQSATVTYPYLFVNNLLDLTPYKMIVGKASTSTAVWTTLNAKVLVSTAKSATGTEVHASYILQSLSHTIVNFSIDISNINSTKYIGIGSSANSSALYTLRLYELILV